MEGLWKGWHFTMIGMRNYKIFQMRDMHYHAMVMCMFCLPLNFSAGFVILDTIQYNLIFNTFYKICMLISSP